jgi:hypothetical protein
MGLIYLVHPTHHPEDMMTSTESLLNLRVSPLAIISFILACFLVTSPIALVLALVAISEINHNPGVLRGRGLAKSGVVLSVAGLLWASFCLVKYQANVRLHREEIRNIEAAISGVLRDDPSGGRLSKEYLRDYERMKRNPPTFLDPFNWGRDR